MHEYFFAWEELIGSPFLEALLALMATFRLLYLFFVELLKASELSPYRRSVYSTFRFNGYAL